MEEFHEVDKSCRQCKMWRVNLLVLIICLCLPCIRTFLYKNPFHHLQRKIGATNTNARLFRAQKYYRLFSTPSEVESTKFKFLFQDASSKAISIDSLEKLKNATDICRESISTLTDTKVLLKSFESLIKQYFTTQLNPIQLRIFEQVSEAFLLALMNSYSPEKLETDMFDDITDLFLDCVETIHKAPHSRYIHILP
jgi:hypothetical protein